MILLLAMMACTPDEKDDGRDTDPGRADTTDPSDDTQTTDDTESTDTQGTDTQVTDTQATDTQVTDTSAPPDTGPAEPLPLCVNEFMPDNVAALLLESGEAPDWIELHNPTDAAVSLAGWTLGDAGEMDDGYLLPEELEVAAGGFLLLYADGEPATGPEHMDFRLSADGGDVGLFAPDGRGQVVSYGNIEADFSAARVSDCCEGSACWDFDFRGSPGESNVPGVVVTEELVSGGGFWRYEDSDSALGADWKTPDYDDSGWSLGPAPLGYGDSHQVTAVASGPSNDRIPTVYFRATFEVADPAVIQAMTIELMLDDGAVVWLNGEEATRVNLADGLITHESFANEAVSEPAEYTFYGYPVDAALLVEGENILAVEVHQAAPDSSDLTFDLAVTVEVEESP